MSTNKSVKNTSDTTKSFVDTKTLLIVPLIKETQSRHSLAVSLLRGASVETLARKSLGDSLLRGASVETLARKSLGDSLLRGAQVETLARKSLGDSLPSGELLQKSLAGFLPSGELLQKSLAGFLPSGELLQKSLAGFLPSGELLQKSLAGFLPSGELLQKSLADFLPSGELLQKSLADSLPRSELLQKSLGDFLSRGASVETLAWKSVAASLQRADTYEHFNYWKSMNGPRNTQSRGKSMLNHDELPKIKRLLRGIGKKHSTPYLEFEIHLNMKKGKYDPEARLTRYQLGVRFSTPDDVSHEETVRRASEINLSELIFETIREEYPDARIAKVRGQNGIYVPVLCGSLVLSDREYA